MSDVGASFGLTGTVKLLVPGRSKGAPLPTPEVMRP